MMTPVVAEIPSKSARRQRQAEKALRASRAAVYVPYRRRTATGTIRVATAMVEPRAR